MTTLGNPLLLGGEGYQISRSVRLRSSASAYFNRTPGSAGNRKTWTWSGWVKRGALGSGLESALFTAGSQPSNTYDTLLFLADFLRFSVIVAGVQRILVTTSAVYRDPSSYYHLVLSVDTTQATNSNGIRLWVNGVLQSLTFTAYTQNQDCLTNSTSGHRHGVLDGYGAYLDGYLTEVNFIDGQALTPSSFGETDVITGVWKPKKYAGTYGTNGFFLNFADNSAATAAAIGKDSSGNGNNWTPNNISVTAGATYDSMIDVPTMWADGGNGRGNYATLNPLNAGLSSFTSEANLRMGAPSANLWYTLSSTIPLKGKVYFEAAMVSSGSPAYSMVGVSQSANGVLGYVGSISTGYGYDSTGNKNNSGSGAAYGAAYTNGDVIGVAFDADALTLTFYKNGTTQGLAYTVSAGEYFAGLSTYNQNTAINFGQRPFAYTPPTGFKALNTQNLPEPTIKKGNQWFDATTYTGTGASRSVTNAGGFQPDLVWAKGRNGVYNNVLQDAVRGAGLTLQSDQTAAEVNEGTSGLTSFNSNGFTIGGSSGGWNANNVAYVAWQWKESASAGFDIVTYTGTGANRTVAHSLGVTPDMMIVKPRSTTGSWSVYSRINAIQRGSDQILALDSTSGSFASSTAFQSTQPTASSFSVGTSTSTNGNGTTYVAYLFAEVAGFSKFGSYTGNGSTDGPFVFCGFRPKFVMWKRSNSTGDWVVIDSERSTFNSGTKMIYPHLSNAEVDVGAIMDFTSNGFKLRFAGGASVNESGGTYIFAAFAEHPFKTSLAR